jgi:hypothetical protein
MRQTGMLLRGLPMGVYPVKYLSKATTLCGSVSVTNAIPVSAPAMCAS